MAQHTSNETNTTSEPVNGSESVDHRALLEELREIERTDIAARIAKGLVVLLFKITLFAVLCVLGIIKEFLLPSSRANTDDSHDDTLGIKQYYKEVRRQEDLHNELIYFELVEEKEKLERSTNAF